jgi:hypothetical protein
VLWHTGSCLVRDALGCLGCLGCWECGRLLMSTPFGVVERCGDRRETRTIKTLLICLLSALLSPLPLDLPSLKPVTHGVDNGTGKGKSEEERNRPQK